MDTRKIGSLDVSAVGLGCNNFGMTIDEDATKEVVRAALDAGITYFDTADVYGGGKSEGFLARALGKHRDEVVIATKFGAAGSSEDDLPPGSAAWAERALDRSLGRMGIDVIDHLQLHTPDPKTPIEETLGALNEAVKQGKVREIGCSNFDGALLDSADTAASAKSTARFVSTQNHYSIITRTPETDGALEACRRHHIALVPYFPLESGLLTGKYKRGEEFAKDTRLGRWGPKMAERFANEQRINIADSLSAFAAARGHSLLELAFAWLLDNPTVASVIAGATKPEQVNSNVGAATAGWKLSADDRAEIDRIVSG